MALRLLNLLTALSLTLCVAAAALWIRSYVVQDQVHVHRQRTGARFYKAEHDFYSVRGQLIWRESTFDLPPGHAELERRARERNQLKDFTYRPVEGFHLPHRAARPARVQPRDPP